jgi:NADH:ubiquinone oxidoreductase subunit D
MVLNFGPGHPAAHGVLRLVIELSHEVLSRIDVHVGLLHRSTEKLMELKSLVQIIPYFDRLDYMSCFSQEDALISAMSVYLDMEMMWQSSTLRLELLEITRLLNHFLAIACHVADIGAITPILWLFEERERYYELLERLSGSRMHNAMFVPFLTTTLASAGWLADLYSISEITVSRIEECLLLFDDSSLIASRLHNIGVVSFVELLSMMITGPILRSAGISFDVRTWMLDVYAKLTVGVCYSSLCDCYDRLFIRSMECLESIRLILIGMSNYLVDSVNQRRGIIYHSSIISMEMMISLFVRLCAAGAEYATTVTGWNESPKGLFGVYLAWMNDCWLFRGKIRCTGIHHLMGMLIFTRGDLIADLVAVIGTIDIVFGEIDR